MPVTFTWYDKEQGLLLNKFVGRWTWQEVNEAMQNSYQMATEVIRVDVLVDLQQSDYAIPQGTIRHLPRLANAATVNVPNWGISVIITDNRLVSILYGVASAVSIQVKHQYQLAKTTDEALRIIQQHREQALT